MEFPYVVKATQKSGKPDAFVWFTAKTEARANLMLDVALEDAGIETGRGKEYAKPIRTDFPVVDDLPEEGEVDFTWCDRYELAEDQRTWNLKLKADDVVQEEKHLADDNVVDGETGHAEESQQSEQPNLTVVATLPFRQRVLAQFIGDGEYLYHVDAAQKNEIVRLEMDTDDAYVQNLLLAAENVEAFKKAIEHDIHKVVNAVKKVFPVDGKKPELATVIQFLTVWFKTEYIDRGLLVKEWQKGNRVAQIQRTDVKTNAGGGNKTDRNTDYVHTLDTLDVEIALATLPMDFNIYDIPGGVYRRAKEIVSKKESPFSEWSEALRKTAGILDYSRAAIFALIRGTSSELVNFPGRLRAYINANLTENDHSNPSEETLADAGHAPDVSWENEVKEQVAAEQKTAAKQPQIANMGNGVFSIDGLMGDQQTHTDDRSPVNEDTTSNVQMEEAVSDEEQAGNEVQSGESSLETGEESHTGQQADVNQNTDSVAQNSDSVNQTEPVSAQTEPETQSDEPAVVYPAYFEPGRYEGLPNEVYHGANGISSTQVKDARVSLMFYHGRHVTKTIRRESSEALTFGSLAHTLALEPEKLHEEFAVFPGIPAEAFTTTDSMKAFIREFNADKPKAEQLKLTGKKEELQAAIRAVSPEAIFADEFEQQWRDSVDGKTILSREQLTLATAIQQALLNHESAGKLLRHPSRSVETSYFGMDDETGLEVRVRPDLEVQINGVRIGVDLKTISMGRVKQDGLRAKLHREIIDRDYHLSAGMYCSVADFDQFFWIFVNKDEGYHWVAVIEASEDLLDLGLLEYQRTMRALANAYDTDCWSAPITEDYTDELNDFDLRRLEALRLA
ncbi:Exodeoxyribonuclease 8 [Citrobacter freundii]|uniref:RecE family exodeoxyribonuclease n=1 Tax=Citrobacter freundii complex TaxID=1344959 RepID=UPI001D2F1CD0|nr:MULTISPECIES: RecE family exodeoxyribonuclease [Citrobacter freundii complex]MDT7128766.1 RecE family exodeoxyribonuclease [Citrobacter braakii]UJB75502.1 PD-(D/E)XK nuclease-like domain-containing protein [Citrobacter portucalensis]WHM95674.1 PD-(D/E)XK nuclease-like domain-containing protein [Citrobacter freundii]CAE7405513.1 Exodeoxyribonuclease 8 [Citrobacter freundii]CAE7408555.1 Exodeoxyribonuclease 8 [Citrobacter freundii]